MAFMVMEIYRFKKVLLSSSSVTLHAMDNRTTKNFSGQFNAIAFSGLRSLEHDYLLQFDCIILQDVYDVDKYLSLLQFHPRVLVSSSRSIQCK
jgi:hypothetical protein